MKTTKIMSLLLLLVLVSGCKRDNWLDWKMQNELWLTHNAKQEGVITTPTGLQYKCIEAGWDKSARPDDAKIVTIDYTGQLINEYVFDSADEAIMQVSSLVAGFAEGLKKMNQFGEYEFYIPYYLGYGQNGTGTEGTEKFIPPYSTLIFRVYLHSVN
ncbi:MAG: FKBP-type peptidyl-prolyl cis-trans isomerase [Paludibacteraceae bacterium]|nr:FKBP-type peptidyl-prolyl cis-trans isomerase [Paludibacteraceae bacterium]